MDQNHKVHVRVYVDLPDSSEFEVGVEANEEVQSC